MKARIYFAIDPSTHQHQVAWIDPRGEKHRDILVEPGQMMDLADVKKEFEILHPGAVYVSTGELTKLWEQIIEEKARLAEWNAGAPINRQGGLSV